MIATFKDNSSKFYVKSYNRSTVSVNVITYSKNSLSIDIEIVTENFKNQVILVDKWLLS